MKRKKAKNIKDFYHVHNFLENHVRKMKNILML